MDIINKIIEQWEVDAKIDPTKITDASLSTPILHSKYLHLLADWKRKQSQVKNNLYSVKQLKIRYYRGELSKEELDKYQWKQWQYNKPLKNELESLLQADKDVVKVQAQLEQVDTIVYVLDSIMTQIKQRDFEISNYIKIKMFERGEG